MADQPEQVPIFELPLAIVPSERVPLHIFEERYKRMIAHCLKRALPFGIVLRTDDGTRAIGCAASVTDVVERFDDGRLNIIVTGEWPFQVLDRLEGPEFPLARVRRLADQDDPDADPTGAQEAFQRLVEAIGVEAGPQEQLDSAFEIAGRVEMPVESKQELLEAPSEPARLELLAASLDALTVGVQRAQAIAARAAGNGHAGFERGP